MFNRTRITTIFSNKQFDIRDMIKTGYDDADENKEWLNKKFQK